MNYPHQAHKRSKPKAGAKPTAKQIAHREFVRKFPCVVCGSHDIAPHHVTGYADRMGRLPRNHDLLAPLCRFHHQNTHNSKTSVEALNHRGFFKKYGIDLMRVAEGLRKRSIEEGRL